uniref:Uncharacterized protein n=1 Tax=Parascaris equorum TaxID=6256 RepID=A0A914RL68_PAREQ
MLLIASTRNPHLVSGIVCVLNERFALKFVDIIRIELRPLLSL